MSNKLRIAGINWDHMHMGDLLRQVTEHDQVELVGVWHHNREQMLPTLNKLKLSTDLIYDDYRQCLEKAKPDLVILCPSTAQHADWVEKVAPYNVHLMVEKPFASTLAEADRMIAAQKKTGKTLSINWPLRWYPSHATAYRLVREGAIGPVLQVHYYDGNRGPLRHVADKETVPEAIANAEKAKSWWYKRETGGGSLLDYLGYGTTLATWYLDGKAPIEVTAAVDQPEGLEVDEQSITIARYDTGLSKFETRWGTFTDPWVTQPQPKCGFVIVGREGTISSYDYEKTIRLQTRKHEAGIEVPVDDLAPLNNPIRYLAHCIKTGQEIDGPLSTRIARVGQQIVDSAALSAKEKRTVKLVQ